MLLLAFLLFESVVVSVVAIVSAFHCRSRFPTLCPFAFGCLSPISLLSWLLLVLLLLLGLLLLLLAWVQVVKAKGKQGRVSAHVSVNVREKVCVRDQQWQDQNEKQTEKGQREVMVLL